MYVCNCNGIRQRQLLDAAESGARQPGDVFVQYKCAAKCGRCIEEMKVFLTSIRNKEAMAAQ
jgi:bacterioferritin-associated ferredoxin